MEATIMTRRHTQKCIHVSSSGQDKWKCFRKTY